MRLSGRAVCLAMVLAIWLPQLCFAQKEIRNLRTPVRQPIAAEEFTNDDSEEEEELDELLPAEEELVPQRRASKLPALSPRIEKALQGDDEPDSLSQRIRSLEKQNAELLRRLDKQVEEGKELSKAVKKISDKNAPKPGSELSMKVKWNNGLEAQTEDKRFRVHIGGRVHTDGVWMNGTNGVFGKTGGSMGQDAVDVRRARFRIDGTMYETIDWIAEYDFANSFNAGTNVGAPPKATTFGTTSITELSATFREIPFFGNITIGNTKDPIGMEHLTSNRFLDFMERSYIQDAYTGAFNTGFVPGIKVFNTFDDQYGTWATGMFKNQSNPFGFGVGDGEYSWTSRVTYLPWYEDEGKNLWHIGGSGSIRDPESGLVRYRDRGSLRNGPGVLAPIFVDTGSFRASTAELMGGEMALQFGSLLFQGEYMGNWNQNAIGVSAPIAKVALGTVFTHSWYTEALYFLTGENREYDRKAGVFGRLVPKHIFSIRNHEWGAWQIGLRYSEVDLNSGRLQGGAMRDWTAGLNWILTPNLKIQWNYAYSHREGPFGGPRGYINGFGTRLSFDF